jgi:predicted permease
VPTARAAWHHGFDEKQVPILNKMVLLYAVPMSISVGMLIVWAPALSFIIVLTGFQAPQALDNSLSLLGQAAGGVGLSTTGIVLQAQRVWARGAVTASIFTAPIVVTLAVQYGVAEREVSSALLLSPVKLCLPYMSMPPLTPHTWTGGPAAPGSPRA